MKRGGRGVVGVEGVEEEEYYKVKKRDDIDGGIVHGVNSCKGRGK